MTADAPVGGLTEDERAELRGFSPTLPTDLVAFVERIKAAARAEALREFVRWVAINRAYNGSDHQHGQSLYNECLNASLPEWAEEWLTLSADVDDRHTGGGHE